MSLAGLRNRKKPEYTAIDLDIIDHAPSSSGSETSLYERTPLLGDTDSGDVVLYNKQNVQKQLGSKLHKGYGLNKLARNKNVSAAPALAGDTHFQIFSEQLGIAAADPNNFITKNINKNRMYKVVSDILNNEQVSSETYHKLIRDGVMTRNEADIKYGLHLIELKEQNRLKLPTNEHDGWIKDYPHVGPGNKILPKATNNIDNIARNHDIAYGNAKTKTEIHQADKEFVKEMSKIEPKTWGESAIKHGSKLAISAKNKVEEISGHVFYPSEVNNLGKY